jgi:2,3-dimethylmalate lyase
MQGRAEKRVEQKFLLMEERMKSTTKLRELLKGDEIIVTPGVYDCLTARLAETVGFTAVKLLGNVTCGSLLGLPDLGLIGLNEMANHAKNVAAAVDIPVMVDADTGYSGGPLGIARTIKEFERAGVAGIGMEDQVTPKKCALIPGGTPVVPIKEQVRKLQAAVEAREDPDFVISARRPMKRLGLIWLESPCRGCAKKGCANERWTR